MKKIRVVGAGFSGLSLAYYLAKKGCQVDVYEKNETAGGLIKTLQTKSGLVETGASSIIASHKAKELFKDLNLNVISTNPESKNRYLYRGKPTKWPLKIFETLCFVFKIVPKIVLHLLNKKKSPLIPRSNETLHDWGTRCLGKSASEFILEPAMNGIYAGEPTKLSAVLILGHLFKQNREKYKGLYSFKNGMGELISSLEIECKKLGVNFLYNSDFALTELDIPTIVATDVESASIILKSISPEISNLLSKIPKINIVRATSFWKNRGHQTRGFGILIPNFYKFKTMGILFNSDIFNQNNNLISESQIAGGGLDSNFSSLSDEDIKISLLKERSQILNTQNASPEEFNIVRWNQKLPHYTVELENILQAIPRVKNLYLHGNYLGGIGLSKILDRSYQLAEELSFED